MSRATRDLTLAGRDQLLNSSVRNNSAVGITGLLLCDGTRFLQAIEGEEDSIEQCYRRIRADKRHFDLVEFENVSIDNREFGQWSMNCRSQLVIDTPDFRRLVREDVASVRNDGLRAMFIGFAALAR